MSRGVAMRGTGESRDHAVTPSNVEDDAVFLAMVASMTAEHDYGAYETACGVAFGRFEVQRFGALLFVAVRDGFIERNAEQAGNWLGQPADRGPGCRGVRAFNRASAFEAADVPELLPFIEPKRTTGGSRGPDRRAAADIGLTRPGAVPSRLAPRGMPSTWSAALGPEEPRCPCSGVSNPAWGRRVVRCVVDLRGQAWERLRRRSGQDGSRARCR